MEFVWFLLAAPSMKFKEFQLTGGGLCVNSPAKLNKLSFHSTYSILYLFNQIQWTIREKSLVEGPAARLFFNN